MCDAVFSAMKLFGRPIPQSDCKLPPPQADKVSGPTPDCLESEDHEKVNPARNLILGFAAFCILLCFVSLNGPKISSLQNCDPIPDISGFLKPCEVISTRLSNYNEANQKKSTLNDKVIDPMPDKEANTQGQEKRYWTAGGTMRNVPVGAGKRKNKHSAIQSQQITIPSDGVSITQPDTPDSTYHQVLPSMLSASLKSLKGNVAILKLGPEKPLCESKEHIFELGEQKGTTEIGFAKETRETPNASLKSDQNGSGHSKNSVCLGQNGMHDSCNVVALPHTLHYYVGPWGYPWGPGWNNISSFMSGKCPSDVNIELCNSSSKPAAWIPPPMLAASAFCVPITPYPLMPSFWGCMTNWPNGAWSAPWLVSNGVSSTSLPKSYSGCSTNGSPVLGKHSRDSDLQGEEKFERFLWVPKTLRIDDPDEAAKSSNWAILGIKPGESDKQGGIFKGFQSKTQIRADTPDAAQVLQANPAALLRSKTFHERT
ncbi:hypothetical protein IEQ34_011783 [Dendrobium chrysotoxum]|uniref:Dof-type domain-containing protein n=1 Tax=Dendrobium chrysotoxum TaxID=161865 RepID=A0AAV7GAY9_DENCH|nr:hypothetical protein IEQ34_011783 [Dendrobium chrysotoxum]